MIIVGIDPGTQRTGYGIINGEGSTLLHVDCGIIAPPAKYVLSEKVKFIYDGLMTLLRTHRPDSIAIEEVFVAKNSRRALVLGHARGVALAPRPHGAARSQRRRVRPRADGRCQAPAVAPAPARWHRVRH